MDFKHIKTVATDWSVIDYYEIPTQLKFTTIWWYGGGWLDSVPRTEVKQTAHYVSVVRRRCDGSFFAFDVLDEEWVTIRWKHCKGIPQYLQIYHKLVGG